MPLLMIPTAQPQIRSADDWEARFETVRSTFSSRVGQICNAALDRSIIAYNENSDATGAGALPGGDGDIGHPHRAGDRLGQERHPPRSG